MEDLRPDQRSYFRLKWVLFSGPSSAAILGAAGVGS